MDKEVSGTQLSCDNGLGEIDSAAITKTTTIRRTVTHVCEVITDLSFSEPTQLSAPQVPEAQGGILDLNKFTGDATVNVKKWSFMAAGQRGWLEGKGTLQDGSPHTITLMDDEPITAGEVENGVSRVLPREELVKLRDGSQLTFVFKASVDACCEKGAVVVFPELTLTIKLRVIEIRELFEEQTLRKFPANGVVDTPTMTITFKSGAGTAGIVVLNNNAFASGKHYGMTLDIGNLPSPQIHSFVFKHKLIYLKYGWMWKQNLGAVSYFDEDNTLLQRLEYPTDNAGGMWLEYIPPLGKTVSSMVMEVRDYSFVDNFTMRYYG